MKFNNRKTNRNGGFIEPARLFIGRVGNPTTGQIRSLALVRDNRAKRDSLPLAARREEWSEDNSPSRPDFPQFDRQLVMALLGVMLIGLVSTAQAQQPKPAETQWPGVKVEVYQITRIADNRVAVRFSFNSSPSAPAETLIANQVFPVLDESAWEAYETSAPYSLEGGSLVDESTGKNFPPSNRRPDEPRPGRSYKKIVLPRNSGFLIGMIFECPPINEEKPPKKQVVSIRLPGVPLPITGVPLPRELNQPLQFRKPPPKAGE